MKDTQLFESVERELNRQRNNIELIASENFVSEEVLQLAGSVLTNKYAEGYPKKDIMGDKTVRVRADLHHIIKIETAKNGGNVKEVMDKALEEYIRKYLPDKL